MFNGRLAVATLTPGVRQCAAGTAFLLFGRCFLHTCIYILVFIHCAGGPSSRVVTAPLLLWLLMISVLVVKIWTKLASLVRR